MALDLSGAVHRLTGAPFRPVSIGWGATEGWHRWP